MLNHAMLTTRGARITLSRMSMKERIREKLAVLDPVRLEIHDESHRHRGHAGARPGGETHFRLEVVARSFAGKSRIERQRAIYALLAEELKERVHALQITALAPDEIHV
jgi:BolA family transcriptional regulator, general stress-responsive regulator